MEDYSAVIDIDPNSGKVYSERAMVYEVLGKYAEVIKDYIKCLELNYLNHPLVWLAERAKCYAKLNKYEEAIEDYRKVIELGDKKQEVFNEIGKCYEKLEKYEEAIENYREASSYYPNQKEYYKKLSWLYKKKAGEDDMTQIKIPKIEEMSEQDKAEYEKALKAKLLNIADELEYINDELYKRIKDGK